MRYLTAAMLALALAGCKGRQSAHDAALAVAQDAAEDAITPVTEQVKGLEERLTALESELRTLETLSQSVNAALDEERKNRIDDVTALRDHYNEHLRQHHGAP